MITNVTCQPVRWEADVVQRVNWSEFVIFPWPSCEQACAESLKTISPGHQSSLTCRQRRARWSNFLWKHLFRPLVTCIQWGAFGIATSYFSTCSTRHWWAIKTTCWNSQARELSQWWWIRSLGEPQDHVALWNTSHCNNVGAGTRLDPQPLSVTPRWRPHLAKIKIIMDYPHYYSEVSWSEEITTEKSLMTTTSSTQEIISSVSTKSRN